MHYFTARIRAKTAYIGYSADNQRRTVALNHADFVEKVIKLDRILSFTEDHLFVACPHDTVEVWEYEGDLGAVKKVLRSRGMLPE